jgi:signal transduction histidine kinase
MKERNRMAREIHDTLAQGLAAIGLHLSAIQSEGSAASREQHVAKARRLVETNLAEARRSVWDLHPQYLERSDLFSGLTRMVADLAESTNVQIDVRTSGIARRLPADVEKGLFRIAQEAVANAIRHAAARQIRIELDFRGSRVLLTVSDDGQGFDPAGSSRGFGLTSMRERAAQIGSELRIDSQPHAGTAVTVSVSTTNGGPATERVAAFVRRMGQRMARPRRVRS